MKNRFLIFFLLLSVFHLNTVLEAQVVLFEDDFTDAALWPDQTGTTSVKTVATPYGDVKYLNISSYPTTHKKYADIDKVGFLDFRAGSTTIGTTNSYIELPVINFVNGGIFEISYGAGSTSKKLRLQEWDGSAWQNSTYEVVSTLASSTWYTQQWVISGAGEKKFRLIQVASPNIYVAHIKIFSTQPVLNINETDVLDFGLIRANSAQVIKPYQINTSYLLENVFIETVEPYKISTSEDGLYLSSISLPPTGGFVYVKYQPSTVGVHDAKLIFNSYGATTKEISLHGQAEMYSSENQILSFKLDGYSGIVDNATKSIVVKLPWSKTLPLIAEPMLSYSQFATLLTTGPKSFDENTSQTYTVKAENGDLVNYTVSIQKAPLAQECYFSEFILGGKRGEINGNNISVELPIGFDISSLKAIYKTTGNSKLLATHNTFRNFTNPLPYTVLAEDGITTKTYTVTVNLVDGVYRGSLPYYSDITASYDDPVWIMGGGETGAAPFQPAKYDEGGCKSQAAVYRLSEVVDAGNTICIQVEQCGEFKVGLSANGARQIELSSDKGLDKDTITVSAYTCGYGSISVNSSSDTKLYIKAIKATGATSIFSIEITAPVVTGINEQARNYANAFAKNESIVLESSIKQDYTIYAINGVALYRGTVDVDPVTLAVRKGVYIVKIAQESFKIIVK